MKTIRKRLLILLATVLMLCCGLLVGCGYKDEIVNLKRVYVVYPNLNFDVFLNSSSYNTREAIFCMDKIDDDVRRYWGGNSNTYFNDELAPTFRAIYDGKENKWIHNFIYDEFIGYTFLGIYDRREGGNRVCYTPEKATADEVRAMRAENYYYAHFDPIAFTIEFDSGEGSPVNGKTVFYDTMLTSFAVPTPPSARYVFDGWYSDSGLTDRITDGNGEVLLYKQQFNAANYQLGCFLPLSNGKVSYVKSEEELRSVSPELAKKYKGFTSTLHAKYVEKEYTVEFDYGYGREEMNTETAVIGGHIFDRLPSPEVNGYKVAGWSYDVDGYLLYDGEEITRDTALHAVWRAYKYVDLWSEGQKVKNLVLYYGSVFYPSTAEEFALEREGYTLVGWYTSPYFEPDTLINVVNFADSYTALYAKWEAVS